MQPEQLQQIMGYYSEDAKNHLDLIQQHLRNLERITEDPERVSDLLGIVRCGIVGGANLLPISRLHISSIHQTGFCLVDCFKVFQQEGAVKVDQKLQDLLMQVLDALKALIEPLRQSSGLTDEQIEQVVSEVELVKKALMEHLNELVQRSRCAHSLEIAIASELDDDPSSLEELESIIDELSVDSSV
ncbi:MAG TPA: hypothetical protein V6D11_16985 [Waterburya sp.]|jgi:chemosensory pili system protein ChpA (sensor histidine kinase/response regulator)